MASNLLILQLDPQGHTTCIGIAKTTGQQCRNAVGRNYRSEAQRLLINDQHEEGRPRLISHKAHLINWKPTASFYF
jgi:hypothetical protein